MDFSGSVDKSPPANRGAMGLIPGLGRFHTLQRNSACVPQLLRPCAATTEVLRPWSLCLLTREAKAMRGPSILMKSSPHSLQLEKACVLQQRHSTAKNKFINKRISLCASTKTRNSQINKNILKKE